MFFRLAMLGARVLWKSSGRSWLLSAMLFTGATILRWVSAPRGTLDDLHTNPGDKIVIEHLTVTHREQLRGARSLRRQDRRRRRATRRDRRRAKRLAAV